MSLYFLYFGRKRSSFIISEGPNTTYFWRSPSMAFVSDSMQIVCSKRIKWLKSPWDHFSKNLKHGNADIYITQANKCFLMVLSPTPTENYPYKSENWGGWKASCTKFYFVLLQLRSSIFIMITLLRFGKWTCKKLYKRAYGHISFLVSLVLLKGPWTKCTQISLHKHVCLQYLLIILLLFCFCFKSASIPISLYFIFRVMNLVKWRERRQKCFTMIVCACSVTCNYRVLFWITKKYFPHVQGQVYTCLQKKSRKKIEACQLCDLTSVNWLRKYLKSDGKIFLRQVYCKL